MEDTTGYATTNSTGGYAESVLGAGMGSNGKVSLLMNIVIPSKMVMGALAVAFIPIFSPFSPLSHCVPRLPLYPPRLG